MFFKESDGDSDEEDDGGDADDTEEKINKLENFKVLQGDVIETQLLRSDVGGYGLALSGHKDRNRMGTFICGINPKGAAAANGLLQEGDELLKVRIFPSSRFRAIRSGRPNFFWGVANNLKCSFPDSTLQFHHTVVRGRSHLNVSAIIKKAPFDEPIQVVVLRGKMSQEKRAVKKALFYPETLDDVVTLAQ